jgi:SecD/SecF fusion protein
MQRNYLRGLLICLVPCLVAALFAVRADKYRLGIDLAGGTILVYEVNVERTAIRKQTEQGKDADPSAAGKALTADEVRQLVNINDLAAQIKKRIDPTDIKNVTVRPSGDRRVEIILPLSGAASSGKETLNQEDIEEVKRLISQMGVLEFRIIANGTDDQEGLRAARDAIDAANKSGALKVSAEAGLPPPAPVGDYNVEIGESKSKVKYVWTELAPEYRADMGLSNSSEGSAESNLWAMMKGARDRVVPLSGARGGWTPNADLVNCTMILYSRECVSRERLAIEALELERLRRDNPGKKDEELEPLRNRKKVEYFVLTRTGPEDSVKIENQITLTASAGQDKSFNPSVDFSLNSAGGQLFGKMTRRNKKDRNGVGRLLAVVLDEKLVSAATIESEITTRGQITGKFDLKKVNRDVQILRSGALNAELREKPVSENKIGPTLGADTIRRGTLAIGLAFAAVLAFMVVYYRFAGLVACVALFANLLLTIGFMVSVNAAFTLAGLAGLVLTLGIAVDANVLIYERLREERNKGANLATAIRNGYDRAFGTIIDTHITSIVTAIVLYVLGNDNLKGFAISLTVGLVISLFTSLYMTRLMFDYCLHIKVLTELRMMKLFDKTQFNPMKYRFALFTFTGVVTVLTLGLFLWRGERGLNVDFRGGTVFAGVLKPGEERGLTATDGKPGFRELLGEENQKKRLTAKAVEWTNPPVGDAVVNVWEFLISYESGPPVRVALTEKPAGDTAAAIQADVLARAKELPDVSVEQTFLSTESTSGGKSRRFTVRTTEKQVELVRANLNRLLSDDKGASLLDGASLTHAPVTGPVVKFTFDKPTSVTFVSELLNRAFRDKADSGADTFALVGKGAPIDGRYNEMELDVSRNPKVADLKDAKAAGHASAVKVLSEVLDIAKRAFDGAPEPERLEVFDSQLAKETRTKAVQAIAVSWVAILLYLWLRFGNWTFGLAAVLCLIHDLCFTLGAIAVCHYLHLIPGFDLLGLQDFKIDLAAIAALLTLVGYSVSDTIVVFDRIREVRGKNPKLTPEMINESVNQTLGRTILTATTVFLVSIVLYAFGGEGVHLFAFVMVMGVLVGTYSSIFVAAPLLLMFGEGIEAHAATDAGAKPEAEEKVAGTEEEVVEG